MLVRTKCLYGHESHRDSGDYTVIIGSYGAYLSWYCLACGDFEYKEINEYMDIKFKESGVLKYMQLKAFNTIVDEEFVY